MGENEDMKAVFAYRKRGMRIRRRSHFILARRIPYMFLPVRLCSHHSVFVFPAAASNVLSVGRKGEDSSGSARVELYMQLAVGHAPYSDLPAAGTSRVRSTPFDAKWACRIKSNRTITRSFLKRARSRRPIFATACGGRRTSN